MRRSGRLGRCYSKALRAVGSRKPYCSGQLVRTGSDIDRPVRDSVEVDPGMTSNMVGRNRAPGQNELTWTTPLVDLSAHSVPDVGRVTTRRAVAELRPQAEVPVRATAPSPTPIRHYSGASTMTCPGSSATDSHHRLHEPATPAMTAEVLVVRVVN